MAGLRWILLAEDDDNIRQLIRDSLHIEGDGLNLHVVEAKDGLEAITKAGHREYHCVITDLKMPRSTGEDFIRAMKAHPLNANTPTVVITGHGGEDFSEKYSHIKVIPKPFTPMELARTVIREIKLGRMDDRIAVHLMNPFVASIRSYIEDETRLDLKLEEPVVKRTGEGIIGDVHCTMTLQSEVSKNRFTLSFDKELLEFIKIKQGQEKTTPGTGNTPDVIARTVCQQIFERVAPNLKGLMGGVPRLIGTSIVTMKNESEVAELMRTVGVTLVGRTAQGRVIAAAFSKPKTRRV